jgi:GntR family transcriptional regulator, transcriptional repressor for pyruvate dehydrogenase complex
MTITKNATGLNDMVSHVMRRIHDGKLRPADQMPSENEFAKEFNVARGSVREAFKALEALGILETAVGKRARVGRLNGEVMAILVNNAVETALRRSDQSLTKIADAAKRMRIARGDLVIQTAADIDFHVAIAEATGNPLYTMLIESFQLVMQKTCPIGWNSRPNELMRDSIFNMHDAIVDAIRKQDANAAELAMALHFDNTVQSLISAGVA